jgi:hypothetical protein
MKQELDEYLCKVYPKIFANRYKDMTETAMCWGFDCGDGWFQILNQLCNNIQHHLNWKNEDSEVVAQVVADQVKEKFGTLRFYYTGGDDYISGLVSMAESMSGVTCEECGAPGESGGSGWITTLCETHRAEREQQRAERLKDVS